MPKVYDQFEIVETLPETGEVSVEWIDRHDPNGPRIFRTHKLPTDQGAELLTEAHFRSLFAFEVEDVADIPLWMYKQERDNARSRLQAKARTVRPVLTRGQIKAKLEQLHPQWIDPTLTRPTGAFDDDGNPVMETVPNPDYRDAAAWEAKIDEYDETL